MIIVSLVSGWDDGNSTLLPLIAWKGHDEGDTRPNSDTSAWSNAGKFTKITAEEAAKYLGMEESELTPETCSKQYKEAWNATNTPDPIDTTMTTLEEEVAQLQAENKELMSRVAAIEESVASANGGDGDVTSTSNSAWYDNTIKPMMILAAIAGLISIDSI